MKTFMASGDWHVGSDYGLTMPEHRSPKKMIRDGQAKCWDFFANEVEKIRPIDVLLINGDAIDGKNDKSGGNELTESSRTAQIQRVLDIIKFINPKQYVLLTYGTGYHVGMKDNWEDLIKTHLNFHDDNDLDAKIDGILNFDIDDVSIFARHKIGSSGIPHGRHAALARERLWKVYEAYETNDTAPDILLYSHVHYYAVVSGFSRGKQYFGFTLPALQNAGGIYGKTQCSGIVHFGFLSFDIEGTEFSYPRLHIRQMSKRIRIKL